MSPFRWSRIVAETLGPVDRGSPFQTDLLRSRRSHHPSERGARKDRAVADDSTTQSAETPSSTDTPPDFTPLEPEVLHALATEETARRFLWMFWGLMVIALANYLEALIGLPVDWLGAAIVLVQLLALEPLRDDLARLTLVVRGYLVVAILGWVPPGVILGWGAFSHFAAVLLGIVSVGLLAFWADAWGTAAARWSKGAQQIALTAFAEMVRRWAPILFGVTAFLMLPLLFGEGVFVVTGIVMTGCWLAAMIMLLVLTWRMKRLSLFLYRLRLDHERELAGGESAS